MKAIEFSAPMMLAILHRKKTMTRRKMKPPPEWCSTERWCEKDPYWYWKPKKDHLGVMWAPSERSPSLPLQHAKYQVGDLVWVKEPLVAVVGGGWGEWTIAGYPADETIVTVNSVPILWRWKRGTLPARYCPREASRATVRITSVKAERVLDITEEDAIREGFMCAGHGDDWHRPDSFRVTWEKLHGTGAWECSDWVFAYGFELME